MVEQDNILERWLGDDREVGLSRYEPMVIEQLARHFLEYGFCQISSLISPKGVEALVMDAGEHWHLAHRSEEEVNPFLESPEEVERLAIDDAVRSTMDHFLLRVVAYDQLREDSVLKRLYLSGALFKLVRTITGAPHLERFGDALGAVNLTFMTEGDKVPWHFDHSGYVLSLPLARPRVGGEFEIVAKSEEGRMQVARRMLREKAGAVRRFGIEPGSAILFNGKSCLHRVRIVRGDTPRTVALFGYDIDPEAHATSESTLGRYGRKV